MRAESSTRPDLWFPLLSLLNGTFPGYLLHSELQKSWLSFLKRIIKAGLELRRWQRP